MSDYTEYPDGGLISSGNSDAFLLQDQTISGGCSCGGFSDNLINSTLDSLGGLNSGGTSEVVLYYSIITTSGVSLSSFAGVFVNFNDFLASGGILNNGTSVSFSRYILRPTGGVNANGDNDYILGFVSFGGVKIQGQVENTIIFNQKIISSGLKCSGKNLILINNNFFYQSSGFVFAQGDSKCGIKNSRHISRGGIQITSDNLNNFEFYKVISFKWQRDAYVSKTINFYWNLGQLTMYWYRVIGKGATNLCVGDPCCQKIIMNVHARSISELCQKLSKRRFKFPIDTVQRFRRPAETAVVNELEDSGNSQICNDLIDVAICSVPACADFCVDQDVVVNFTADMALYIVKTHESVGSLFMTGGAESSFKRFVPDFPHQSNGFLFLQGQAQYSTNSYVGRGGAKAGGQSRFKHSRWKYVGGIWPNTTDNQYGKTARTVSRYSAAQPWLLPERVLKQDFLYSTVDVSYNKSSEMLIVRGFSFDLPENCKILKVVVNISRFATQVGVRDDNVYLILDDSIISNNLASKNIDWPLIQTLRQYGSDGWRKEDYQIIPLDSLVSLSALPEDIVANPTVPSREELLDPLFGVAFSVKSTNSTGATLARIEYINIDVTYEDPVGSIIRVSSDSGLTAKSPSYSYVSQGRLSTQGYASSRRTRLFSSKIGGGAITGGLLLRSVFEETVGGLIIGGDSNVTPHFEVASGGLIAGSEADVRPWWITMYGGVKTSGNISQKLFFNYVSDGNIEIFGNAFTPENKYNYGSSGVIQLSGNARIKKQSWRYVSDGNILFILGNAQTLAGNIILPNENWYFDMTIKFNNASFLSDLNLGDAEGQINYFDRCGCFELPSSISLVHNFAKDNIFAKFLTRNNFAISRNLELRHNAVNDSWQHNLHYKGLSAVSENPEAWDILSELQCTNDLAGTTIGRKIWKLALQFSRKDLATGQTFESRIIISVVPDSICVNFASKLDFQITFDTQSKNATISPDAFIYQNSIFDNIGLFKNRAWIENPDLTLRVIQSAASPIRRSYIIPTNARGKNPPEPSTLYVNSNTPAMLQSR